MLREGDDRPVAVIAAGTAWRIAFAIATPLCISAVDWAEVFVARQGPFKSFWAGFSTVGRLACDMALL
jgi:hypothetical protein